jgi:hypothetical protein
MYSNREFVICDIFYIQPYGEIIGSMKWKINKWMNEWIAQSIILHEQIGIIYGNNVEGSVMANFKVLWATEKKYDTTSSRMVSVLAKILTKQLLNTYQKPLEQTSKVYWVWAQNHEQ